MRVKQIEDGWSVYAQPVPAVRGDRLLPKNLRKARSRELPANMRAHLRDLRRSGLKASVYIDPDSGTAVGVTAAATVPEKELQLAAARLIAYAAVNGAPDFDLFEIIPGIGRGPKARALDREMDRLEGRR